MVALSNRLARVAAFVPVGSFLLDIGSDHAYLPIELVKSGHIRGAIAGEAAPGPLAHSIQQIQEADCDGQITARLGDGFAVLTPDDPVDVVTICGMGGDLMSKILNEGATRSLFSKISRFILQPNVGDEDLRKRLAALSLPIIDETLIEEKGHVYPIIVTAGQASAVQLSAKDAFLGPILQHKGEENPLILSRYRRQYNHWQKVHQQLPEGHPQTDVVAQRLQWLKEVLHETTRINRSI